MPNNQVVINDGANDSAKVFLVRKTPPTSLDKYISFYNDSSNNGLSQCCPGRFANGTTYSQANVLPNCVGYACGRFNEIYNQVNNLPPTYMKYPYFNNDAGGFIKRARDIYGDLTLAITEGEEEVNYPIRVGTIIVLSRVNNAKDKINAPGHVLIVEEIISSTHIRISESGWENTDIMRFVDWYWDPRAKMWDNAIPPYGWYHRNDYHMVGYIYNPATVGNIGIGTLGSVPTLSNIETQGRSNIET